MMITLNMFFFHPRSDESSHKPSAQCMFYNFKYSNQFLAYSFRGGIYKTNGVSPSKFSSTSTRIFVQAVKFPPFISRK